MGRTLFDKIWDAHNVSSYDDMDVLYIDMHFIHEVTSPQAFSGIEERKISLFRKHKIVATADHNVPTINQHLPITDPLSKHQVDTLTKNCSKHGVTLYGLEHAKQGIVHVIGPEQGITKPGMTIVCGDSHTSTHGAFGCIAFGIGTSQVEQVFASQCLVVEKPKTMRIRVDGTLAASVSAKDVILYIISQLSSSGGTGYFIEYTGDVIESLSMEERMTVCNMSIEMGARGGIIAPDHKTINFLKNREHAPKGPKWNEAVAFWQTLKSDSDCSFDREEKFHAENISPMLTYGTNPGMAIKVEDTIPHAQTEADKKALNYMGLQAGASLAGKEIQNVFIGSCTNSRIEDLRVVAGYVKGKKKASHVKAYIVPGSKSVEQQAKAEGLDKIFEESGFTLREPGCSACLGMNDDKIPSGEYCVSTSNRNYEGRQGQGARTILSSPLMAAAAAINGKIVDVRNQN